MQIDIDVINLYWQLENETYIFFESSSRYQQLMVKDAFLKAKKLHSRKVLAITVFAFNRNFLHLNATTHFLTF